MKTATLRRTKTGDTGTFGTLEIDGQAFATGELPDRDNAPCISSIPAGEYICKWTTSPKFGPVYEVTGVPDRSHVLIHNGNVCGDTHKGLKSDVEGCILIGQSHGFVNKQPAVIGSRKARDDFEALMGQEDIKLRIVEEYAETGDPAGNVA